MKYIDLSELENETIVSAKFGNDKFDGRNIYGVITIKTKSGKEIVLSSSYLMGEISLRCVNET